VLPIERGAGLTQPALALAARLVADGEWLHLFPEARALWARLAAQLAHAVASDCCRAGAASPCTPRPGFGTPELGIVP
jgi:hypothetical protein